MKILIVEDDQNQRGALTRMLRNRGFEIIEAEDAFQAMQIIFFQKENEIDLIVSDFYLKGKNDLEMLRSLREKGIKIPFILITGNIDGNIEVIAKNAGAKHCLQKPFDIDELVKKIKE